MLEKIKKVFTRKKPAVKKTKEVKEEVKEKIKRSRRAK